MGDHYSPTKELAKHINYAIENFDKKFKPELLNLKTNKSITLTDYQKFTASVMLLNTFKSLLMFWETGFGKTIECVYLMKNIFVLYPQWKIFLFVKSSLGDDPWRSTLDTYLSPAIKQHIYIFHYDIQNTENLFLLRHNSVLNNTSERIFYVFDESHDFIKKLLPKENNSERRLTKVVKSIIKGINKEYNKVLFMTATPLNDTYLEFNYMMSFLRKGSIDISQALFTREQVLRYPELLKKITLGLTSFQRRSDIDIFKNITGTDNLAGKSINFIDLRMSNAQTSMYKNVSIAEKKTRARGFRSLRKMVSTFAYHDSKIKEDIDEEQYLKLLKEKVEVFEQEMKRITFSEAFLEAFANETLELNEDSSMSNNLNLIVHTNVSLSSNLKAKDPLPFAREISQLRVLHSYSSKYIKTCQIIKQAKGKCLVYQPFVSFEGVRTLLSYFNVFRISYIEYTQKTKATRTELVQKFNDKNNIYGQNIKCCVFSSAGTEGISLLNIQDMIIMDLPWSGSILEQIFGRAVRLNSHNDLPREERNVKIHILINHTNNDVAQSVDQEIKNIIMSKETEKKEIISVLDRTSIESIHRLYPDIESVEKENLYPLINTKYDTDQYRKQNISVLKMMINILYTFSENFLTYQQGYLDEDTNSVFNNSELEGYLVIKNGKRVFRIINNELVYLIKK